MWVPLPQAPTLPLQVVFSETFTSFLLPLDSIFSVPLMRLWAFQIDSDITLEVRLVVCVLAWFACIPFYTSYEPFHGLQKDLKQGDGGRRYYQNRNLSFTMQTICYAVCIGYTPSSLIC
jgi:hypothetical protein